jgi:GLPGLI family protein
MKPAGALLKICSSIAVILALFSGCKNSNDKILNEGVIEFDVTAVDPNHPWAGMIPSTSTLKFKDDKFLMEMSTMGMFTTTFICDQSGKTLTQMVKFLDIKQACIEKENEIKKENEGYKVKWEETAETKTIAGYKCKKLKVVMVDDPSVKFEAYYTKDMGAENVNDLSPYNGVKGMLMQYRLKKMGLELQFTAKSVKKAEITDNIFEIPVYFKIVSKAEIEKIFQQF